MARYAPLWQQANSYPAMLDRSLMQTIWPEGGVRGADAAAEPNNLAVIIQPGTAAVPLTPGQGTALAMWDGPETVPLPSGAPPSGNERRDIIVARVRDSSYDGGQNDDFIMAVIEGPVAAPPAPAPAVGYNDLPLWEVVVPGAASNLNNAQLIDRRGALNSGLPIGGIMTWGTNTPPTGYRVCDGSAVSRDTYSVLFGVYGTSWGSGDGITTFNLPDLRDVFMIGVGGILGLGGRGGSRQISWNQMPQHSHGVGDPGHYHQIRPSQVAIPWAPSTLGLYPGPDRNYGTWSNPITDTVGTGIWIGNAGGNEASYLPPAIGMHQVIRVL